MQLVVSKRDADLLRRGKGTGLSKRGKYAVLAVAVIAVIGIAVYALSQSTPETRAANFADYDLADDPFKGDPDAPVVLVGMESPWCSSCKAFHEQILPRLQPLIDEGKLLYVYSQHTWGHQDDLRASVAQECAYEHGGNDAFWHLTDDLYSVSSNDFYSTGRDYESRLKTTAAATDLDESAAISCFNNQDTESKVRDDWRVARDHDLSGTPRFALFGLEGAAQNPNLNEVEAEVNAMVAQWT
jgi:protein-disulfide isomerase